MLYLAGLTVQPRILLPPSSEERSAEEDGKSEAVAYFGVSGEGGTAHPFLVQAYASETSREIKLSQGKDISLKVFNFNVFGIKFAK